ncbi:hypothetical protein J2848_004285 [Azospirillum lipoferum]|uniref:Uncharacterized protein n=1 Tax=Azospirillum lipoferum TaxID=193 RepID=A0A5A9GI42_AZOLI|nr:MULTISPECIES: hypothetical protein [Azospirillum]KAA0594101.1 hypothetical protein FZ942_22005 [Azospirillum lipoferum]MCP1612594.1 hypothetical protein [Azospirillum lipoferum]MDW5531623.1 hypothetical protein [Azospirillum sp. NL1]
MASQDYSILSGILVLERFTVSTLARYAGLSANTVSSWLNRHKEWFVLESRSETGKRGRPQKIWRLADDRSALVKREFEELYPKVAAAVAESELKGLGPQAIWPDSLKTSWESLAAADLARQDDDVELVRLHERNARSWLTLAWEDVEDYAASGVAIPDRQLETIVDVDMRIGKRHPPPFHSVTEAAAWITGCCRERGEPRLPDAFVAALMAAQARRLTDSQSGYLSGGLLVALARASCANEQPVVRVATAVMAALGVQDIARPLRLLQIEDGILYRNPDELLAVILGVKQHPTLPRESVIIDWLQSLPHSSNWQPRLAPIVLTMLAEAPAMVMHRLVAWFNADLDRVLHAPPDIPDWSRQIYEQCADYARRAVKFTRPLPCFGVLPLTPDNAAAPPADAWADAWAVAAWSARQAYELAPDGTDLMQPNSLAAAILSVVRQHAHATFEGDDRDLQGGGRGGAQAGRTPAPGQTAPERLMDQPRLRALADAYTVPLRMGTAA